ncbi:MAG: LysM peptidoglycan-binding domain-containing protein [Bacteroidetes bacterium]|nr:LysM peptidoglycan-binding domain-containing protein [Bacteroidota bacterium]
MKKISATVLVLFVLTFFVNGQKTELVIQKSNKSLYIEHKVTKGESFYAIGRTYNVPAKELAEFNKIDINKGLQIDQKLRIPLTESNFTQKGNSGTPVYFKTENEEKLTTVSKNYGDVSVSALKSWNDISGDVVKKNGKLIVGFVKSTQLPSVTIKPKKQIEEKEDAKTKVEEKKAEVKSEVKNEIKSEVKAEEVKKITQPIVVETKNLKVEGAGYFKSDYEMQIKQTPIAHEETLTSGILKTTSGWDDGKYYLLIDNVSPGTIVKIVNPTNNKAIFAKVLGEMAGIRQNDGYGMRISNAGAAALEVSDQEKFIVKVTY